MRPGQEGRLLLRKGCSGAPGRCFPRLPLKSDPAHPLEAHHCQIQGERGTRQVVPGGFFPGEGLKPPQHQLNQTWDLDLEVPL